MYFKEEELVVESPTRSPKPISQVAENITVVTASDIELMNAHSLAEVLNTVTGVEVWLTGGPGQIAQGFIQGSETRHVTIIIDGVVLNNISSNTVDLGMVTVQNIEKIEIIKGPASSAWGSALGGVVNIITKAGRSDNQGGMLSASYGKANTDDFRAEARGKQGRFGYYLTAGRLQSDGLTTHFDVAENNGYTKLSYDLTDHTAVLFSLGYERTVRGTGTLLDLSFDNIAEIVHSSLAVNSALNKDIELDVSVRIINQEGIFITHSSGVFLGSDKEIDKGYGSSAKLTWKSSIQTIVLGADYDDKTLESKQIAGESKVLTTWALYGNDTVIFNELSITPGFRYDFTSSNGAITSPSLGIAYVLGHDTILRAYTAKGFSIPTPAETFGNDAFFTANPGLKMETVWSYQAGVETAALKYLWMKVSAFRNEIRDAITPETSPVDPTKFTTVNKGRQRRQGIEAEAKTAPIYNLSLSAGAEYIDAKDLDTGTRLQTVPTHVYDLGLRYDDGQSFKALLHGRYINWNSQPDFNGKYGSVIYDLNVIKRIYQHKDASLEAFVNAHNMFNGSQYPIDAFKNPGRWYEGGIRYNF